MVNLFKYFFRKNELNGILREFFAFFDRNLDLLNRHFCNLLSFSALLYIFLLFLFGTEASRFSFFATSGVSMLLFSLLISLNMDLSVTRSVYLHCAFSNVVSLALSGLVFILSIHAVLFCIYLSVCGLSFYNAFFDLFYCFLGIGFLNSLFCSCVSFFASKNALYL